MKLIKSRKAIIHALVWRTEDLDTASKKVAQQTVAIDKDIKFGKEFPVHGKKSSSTTLKNECPTRWTSMLTMLKSIKGGSGLSFWKKQISR